MVRGIRILSFLYTVLFLMLLSDVFGANSGCGVTGNWCWNCECITVCCSGGIKMGPGEAQNCETDEFCCEVWKCACPNDYPCGNYPDCTAEKTYYQDADNDTYGNPLVHVQYCSGHIGYVNDSTDCNDRNSSVYPGANEICNNRDDDCDRSTDEGLTNTATCGIGACQNTVSQNCVNGIFSPSCTPGSPNQETCNGINDDCDSQTDEDLTNTATCGIGACQRTVSQTCAEGVFSPTCTPGNPNQETCNGLDDNCDGTADNDIPHEIQSCTIANGIGYKSRACIQGTWPTQWGPCTVSSCNEGYQISGNSCVPIDCNDSPSEDCPIENGQGTRYRNCTLGVWSDFGPCSVSSCNVDYQISGNTCVPTSCSGYSSQSCEIQNGAGTQTRTCNLGVWSKWGSCSVSSCNSGYQQSDNSCVIIECTGPSSQECSSGFGACLRIGIQSRSCQSGSWSDWSACSVVPGNPATEICNNVDDDCDGPVDEDLSNCCAELGSSVDGCAEDPNCPGISGKKTCENYEWSLCKAECPIELDQSAMMSITEINSVTVLPEIRKEEFICEGRLTKTLDLSKFNEKCQYKTNRVNIYQDAPERLIVDFFIGENTLDIKCGNIRQVIIYNIRRQQNCSVYSKEVFDFKQIINDFVDEGIITKEEEKEAKETVSFVFEKTSMSNKGDSALVTHVLTINESISNLEYRVNIPKECANDASSIDFYLGNYSYEVLRDDPLIAWHFTEIKDRIDLSYRLKGDISQTCLDKIKGLPIAKLLEPKLEIKKPVDIKKIIAPIAVIFVIIFVSLYLQRPKKNEGQNKDNDTNLTDAEFEKQRLALLRQVSEMNFDNKEKAEYYMRSLNISENTIAWVIKMLRF